MKHIERSAALTRSTLVLLVALTAPVASGAESPSAGPELALPGEGATLDLSADPVDDEFVPDTQAAATQAPAGTVPVSKVDPYDKVSVPVPAGEEQGTFFLSIGRNKAGSPDETRGRIYHVSLPGNEAQLVWDHPAAVRVLGHNAVSGKTLIVDKLDQFQRGGDLVMVGGLAAGQAQPHVSTIPARRRQAGVRPAGGVGKVAV